MTRYDYKGINYSSGKNDWKKFDKNNPAVAFNMLYVNICPAYISKQNSNHEQQMIVLMIPNGGRCHYLAAKDYHYYYEE